MQKESLSENFSTTQVKQAFREDQKPSNPSCSTDEIGIGIDESRAVRFRNNLFVVSIVSLVFNEKNRYFSTTSVLCDRYFQWLSTIAWKKQQSASKVACPCLL